MAAFLILTRSKKTKRARIETITFVNRLLSNDCHILSEYAPLETGLFAIRQVIIGQARRMGSSDVRIESNLSSVPHRGRYRYHGGRAHIARVRGNSGAGALRGMPRIPENSGERPLFCGLGVRDAASQIFQPKAGSTLRL